MISYQLGTLAEQIVAVKIGLDGTVTPYVRRRFENGRMTDVPDRSLQRARHVTTMEFAVRVEKGDNGVVALDPPIWFMRYPVALIPLGKGDPFLERELALEADEPSIPAGSFSGAEEVLFRFANNKLTWENENISGEALLNETYPELRVTLRLPAGNRGGFEFNTPIFSRADGLAERLLTVA